MGSNCARQHHHFPPLHTRSCGSEYSQPTAVVVANHARRFRAPAPAVLSMVTGEASYADTTAAN